MPHCQEESRRVEARSNPGLQTLAVSFSVAECQSHFALKLVFSLFFLPFVKRFASPGLSLADANS